VADNPSVNKEDVAKKVKEKFKRYTARDVVKDYIKAQGITSLSGIGDVIRFSGLIAVKQHKKVVGYRPPEDN
jgi:hypothetical protein